MTRGDVTGRRVGRIGAGLGCVASLAMSGVGCVLTGLGLRVATQEAMPFGITMMLLAPVLGAGGATLWWWASRGASGSGNGAGEADVDTPPAVAECPRCGSPAPLCLATPDTATCSSCGATTPLPEELAARLGRAAVQVLDRDSSNRQIARVVSSVATRRRLALGVLAVVAAFLVAAASVVALYGYLTRMAIGAWYTWVAMGLGALGATLPMSLLGGVALAVVTRRSAVRLAARQVPGGRGLACRVCGGPLSQDIAPVLRCDYCSADNLADGSVLALVRAAAGEARAQLQAATATRRRTDELTAITLLAYPVLTLVVWFAVAAVSGTVVVSAAHDVQLDPDPAPRYVLMRVRVDPDAPPIACLAAWTETSAGRRAYLGRGNPGVRLDDDRWSQVTLGPAVPAAWLVGHSVVPWMGSSNRRGTRVRRVYRRPDHLAGHVAEFDGTTMTLMVPEANSWGYLTCLTDIDPGPGEAVSVTR